MAESWEESAEASEGGEVEKVEAEGAGDVEVKEEVAAAENAGTDEAAATEGEGEKVKDEEKGKEAAGADEKGGDSGSSKGDELTKKERRELEAKVNEKKTAMDLDERPHLNIVFIGHVDAGKSTICGRILFSTGQVDARTIEKYEKEAKDKNRQSWFLAYIMDTNEEERAKGKTVECGRAVFSTEKKRYTILDAPGHKNYVPNMIMGAAQADVGILVVSARKGEFETGFDKGGQTREHAMLAKTLGVRQLVVLVNKMDDCQWAQERFEQIQKKILPFLKSLGFNPKTSIRFLPASGFTGEGIAKPVEDEKCKWNEAPHLLKMLDDLGSPGRKSNCGVRLPILDRYKDSGSTTVIGKLEAGTLEVGMQVVIMPMEKKAEVSGLQLWEQEATRAGPGENVAVALKGVGLEDLQPGFVLCSPGDLCKCVRAFDAQLVMMNLRSVFSAGYQAVLHLHTAVEEVKVRVILSQTDKKTKKVTKKPTFLQNGAIATVRLQVPHNICIELFSDYQQLGRFTLRDEGRTIAIGKVVDLPTLRKKPAQ
eukprot:CAMPEP_0119123456 /NCGR_PEP_ID=MMETSP1310-20130426/3398_1 /TAXON_ID=464262 /ORGANISM="Genus nov. species nov., Strain RCC2339" /LENGTH=537 /DNA_ID=CAMNT_0007113277 /DNA_START=46 /DNA_END=1659 /DNA_ORIENTATION=+